MKDRLIEIETMYADEFLEKHGLEIEVIERDTVDTEYTGMRYYAHIKGSIEIKTGGMLVGAVGNGNSPEQAVHNCIKKISEQLLVVNAYTENRLEIQAPRLMFDGGKHVRGESSVA